MKAADTGTADIVSGRDGVWRHGLKGESVDVDPTMLERFDRLNDPD